jgi:hypothetical protein
MKYAVDCHVGDEWGAPDHATGYEYTLDEAEAFAERWMRAHVGRGVPEDHVGCYILSDLRVDGSYPGDGTGADPVVEDLYELSCGTLVNLDAARRARELLT